MWSRQQIQPFSFLSESFKKTYVIIIIIIQVGLLFEVQLNGIPDCKRMVISIRWETKNRKEKRKRKLHYVTLVSVIEDIAFKLNTQSWLNYTNFHVYQLKYEKINWKRKTFLRFNLNLVMDTRIPDITWPWVVSRVDLSNLLPSLVCLLPLTTCQTSCHRWEWKRLDPWDDQISILMVFKSDWVPNLKIKKEPNKTLWMEVWSQGYHFCFENDFLS